VSLNAYRLSLAGSVFERLWKVLQIHLANQWIIVEVEPDKDTKARWVNPNIEYLNPKQCSKIARQSHATSMGSPMPFLTSQT